MPNPIFSLIALKKVEFELHFQIERKTAKTTGKDYFYIVPKVNGKQSEKSSEIMINNRKMRLVDFHISVYEDLTPEQGKVDASHHVTLNLAGENQLMMTAHVHFNTNNKIVFATLRDTNNALIQYDKMVDISQLAKGLLMPFYNFFWGTYSALHNQYKHQYENLEAHLQEISKKIQPLDSTVQQDLVWETYSVGLINTIKHLKEWHLFEICPNRSLLSHFITIKNHVDAKLTTLKSCIASTSVATVDTPVVSFSTETKDEVQETKSSKINKENNTKAKLHEIEVALKNSKIDNSKDNQHLQPWQKLLFEYELQNKKLQLIEKGDAYLECTLTIRNLESQARSLLIKIILSEKDYKAIKPSDMEQLIKMIPRMGEKDLLIAVNNNRDIALRFMLIHHPYINIDIPVGDTHLTLLERSYERKCLATFQILLDAGAYCDNQDTGGYTLLVKSCEDRREDEMVALLKAGASTFIRNNQSYTALGALTMIKTRRPPAHLIKLFLKNCSNIYIDLYQGPRNKGGTPLNFACQENWVEQAQVLLEFGASPLIARESDFCSSLTICAGKGHADVLRLIFKLSKFPISSDDLGQPYKFALEMKQWTTKKALEEYAKEKGFTLTEQETVIQLGVGASPRIPQMVMQTLTASTQLAVPNPHAFLPLPRASDPPIIGENFTSSQSAPPEDKQHKSEGSIRRKEYSRKGK